jgi:D-alanyl-D-alanine carboxypeptidase/D-alanyl-D-alanine-endopeptidase (penicillin-binding protein 4)
MAQLQLLLAIALAFAVVPHARAEDTTVLTARLTDLVRSADLGDGLGVVVANATTGQRLYTLAAETPRNPASNMKLVTAAVALSELGADYRLRTTLSGDIGADGVVETLVLKGEGDPSLTFADLLSLARRLTDLGVRRVENILVDGSAFDDQILPPAFEQQPGEVASFRAAVAAVSVDRNAYELRVAPGPAADAPANVILRCPDYFALESTITTAASGTPKISADQRAKDDELALRLSGAIPLGIRGVAYERRVESPLSYAGYCMRAALKTVRVAGGLRVKTGVAPTGVSALAIHESAPLSALLLPLGKNSDNFVAEMLLKVVGAHATHRHGSSLAGTTRAQEYLEAVTVPKGAVTMVNGSGLFKGNAIAPDHVVKVLLSAYRDPAIRSEYIAQLAIAGVDGTLHGRLNDLPKARVVRAKTGTLDDAIALSGYVLGKTPNDAIAFSILVNGIAGKQWKARALADDLVRAIVTHLYAN